MNKSRLYNIFLLSCVILILTGCRGGGGGSSGEGVGLLRSSSGDVIGIVDTGSPSGDSGDSGDSGADPNLPFTPVANPEPSSFLLLASGLIGMAIYAKTRLKSKNKNRP